MMYKHRKYNIASIIKPQYFCVFWFNRMRSGAIMMKQSIWMITTNPNLHQYFTSCIWINAFDDAILQMASTGPRYILSNRYLCLSSTLEYISTLKHVDVYRPAWTSQQAIECCIINYKFDFNAASHLPHPPASSICEFAGV